MELLIERDRFIRDNPDILFEIYVAISLITQSSYLDNNSVDIV